MNKTTQAIAGVFLNLQRTKGKRTLCYNRRQVCFLEEENLTNFVVESQMNKSL